MGRYLGVQFVFEIITALLLARLLLRTRSGSVAGQTSFLALAGLAAWASQLLPKWNCYGSTPMFVLAELMDQVGRWLIAGAILGWLRNKMAAPGAGAMA